MRAMLDRGLTPPSDFLLDVVFALQYDPGLVALLVAAGADVNASGLDGMTALHFAAADGIGPLVSELLDAGADPALPDGEGKTALDWALEYGDGETIALLSDDSQ